MTTSNYDNTLDICIGLLMQGESVEDCLRRFPDHAAELEADLRPLADSLPQRFTPSNAARDRARQRLRDALQAGEGTATVAPSPRRNWIQRIRDAWGSSITQRRTPRWAVTAAAAVLMLIAGSTTVVAASSGALPGDALYPVKRTTENVTMAFTFSDTAKARRHLDLAERRADEIAKISESASPGLIAAASANLQANVASASKIIASTSSDSTASQLASALQISSSDALSVLQNIAQGSESSFTAASAAYSQAVEDAAARREDTYVAAPPGSFRLQVADPPPGGIDRLFIEFSKVEIYLPAGSQSHWVTVLDNTDRVDLIRAASAPIVLAQADVESGSYSRIRLTISSAEVVVSGSTLPVTLNADVIDLVRPFTVGVDQLTTLTLDFNSAASLHGSSAAGYSLDPVIRPLASEPPAPSSSPTPPPAPEATPTPATPVEISGVVQIIEPSLISVDGVEIKLGPGTDVDGDVQAGSTVTVDAVLDDTGNLLARAITIGSPPPAASTPTSTPMPTATAVVHTVIEGVVTSVGVNQWVVDGRQVSITGNTVIEVGAALGLPVRVEGVLEPGGGIRATSIQLALLPSTSPTPIPLPTSTSVPGATPTSTSTPSPTPTPGAVTVEVTGKVLSIPLLITGTWKVGNRSVLVTTSTVIDGLALVGKTVTVVGILADDGTIVATHITFASIGANATSTPTSVPPATNTPQPTPTPIIPIDILTPSPSATPTPTSPATATPTSVPTSTPTLASTATPAPTPTPTVVTISGQVTSLRQGIELVVTGKIVHINSSTDISGILLLGSNVTVTGVEQPDGSIIATSITVH